MKKFFSKIVGKPTIISGDATLYRMMAIFGSIAVIIQSIVWTILCLISLTYYGIGAPHSGKNEHLMSAYAYIFTSTYYKPDSVILLQPSSKTASNSTTESCANISPNGLFAITVVYMMITIHLLLASVLLLLAAKSWNNGRTVRQRVTHWIIAVFIMSAWEFSTGLIFLIDFLVCSDREQHNIAAAAITLSALFSKGFVLFVLNLSLSLSLFCIQYCGYSECPV